MASTCMAPPVVGARGDTAGMTEDTRKTRDLPVLRAVVDIYDESGTYNTRATGVERRTGLDHDTVQRALRRLNSAPSFFEKVVDASGGQIIMAGPPLQTLFVWLVHGHRLNSFFKDLSVRWKRPPMMALVPPRSEANSNRLRLT